MRNVSALDTMRGRLPPARVKNQKRLELLSARMAPHVARAFLEDCDMMDALLTQCEQRFIETSIDDIAAVFFISRGEAGYEACLELLTHGAKAGSEYPPSFDRALRMGRSSLGLPPHDRHL